ncbi:hypothetical protein OA101_04220 [Alphaproteobacteria bacterium]|jgi:hypothetical protein|nr:hypothetical protein [Alphaproteobacteria bacterium]
MNETSPITAFLDGYQMMSDEVQVAIAICITITVLVLIWLLREISKAIFSGIVSRTDAKGVLVASIYHSEDGELHIFEHESDKVPKITRDNIFNFPSDNLTKGNVDD